MISGTKKLQVKMAMTFVIYTLISLSTVLLSQSMPQINVRFSNPQFDNDTRMYFLDVELNSQNSPEKLFGMNVRFFYDATMLEFKHMDQFRPGYGIIGELPKEFRANDQSGVQMFNLTGAAAYINGAIQQLDEQSSLEINPIKWVKVFRLAFKVPIIYAEEDRFCPSVVWDLKSNYGGGGFLAGSDGVIITLVENNPDTRKTSSPTVIQGTHLNWDQNPDNVMPYGNYAAKECISINQLVSTEDPDQVDINGYALFQNKPNPFDEATTIDFILPASNQAVLKFYDVTGKSLEEIKGDYKLGRNTVKVERKPWMEESKVIFYRLETDGFQSSMRKMTLINE